MFSPPYLLGIDIGTSGSKTVLVDAHGAVVARAFTEYPMMIPHPSWAEQNPADWWSATVKSIRAVMEQCGARGQDIQAVGLTGQMHGLVVLDKKGDVLRPCIMWNDQRTPRQCEEITRIVGAATLLKLTGNPVLPGFTAPKILWLRENEPQVYQAVAKVLLPKDYVRYKLTGEFYGEVSDASGTSLFHVGGRDWSQEMLDALEIPRPWMPDVTESTVVSSRISGDAARICGLREGTPVVGGGGDQAAQAVGTGVVTERIISVTIGTSGVVFAASEKFRVDPAGRLHAFCHAVPGMWHVMGVTLSAGGSLRWYRDTFCAEEKEEGRKRGLDPYELLTAQAASVEPGCEGLVFLPYLTGERTPHADPDARGVFFGISLRHRKPHFGRAVIEGVSFALKDSLNLIERLGIVPSEVRVSGGGASSRLWRQVLADVLGREILTVNSVDGAAYGAALLAGVGGGIYASVGEACKAITAGELTRPTSGSGEYGERYRKFQSLYRALRAEFSDLAKLF